MAKPTERTLTALLSPFAKAEGAEIPVLLIVGRADRPLPAIADNVIPVPERLAIGRGVPGAGGAAGGTLLLDDPLVSGQHAQIARVGAGYQLTDPGSKNGTFVDGQRVQGTRALSPGARLFVGNHALVFRVMGPHDIAAIDEERAAPLGPVPTVSPVLARLCHKMRRLAGAGGDLLLGGETGVGKEVYARAVHTASGRSGRFVAINCAALPRELVESELFGYRPGAHSTAQSGKTGLIEEAEGGTLFLDEVAEMPAEMQSKLLRFLQDKEIVALGATRPRAVNVRVVAATNRPIVAGGGTGGGGGHLRDDLLGRLGAAPLVLPALRDRAEDLGALVAHFLTTIDGKRPRASDDGGGAGTAGFELTAFRALVLHRWPLNVRELEKTLAAAVALTAGRRPVALADLPDGFSGAPAGPGPAAPPATTSVPSGRKSPEPAPTAEELKELLARHGGQVAEVSRAMGRQRAAVWRWIKQFGLDPDKYRKK